MKIKSNFSWLVIGIYLIISSQVSAQFTTLAIQDFDTIQSPVLGYSLTSGPAMTFSNGYTASTSQIPSSPHGVGGTYGWYTQGQDVTVTFNNVNITGYDTAYISFKLAAFFDVDALDYVLVSISVNNGTTWYDRVRINGNGSNCSWSYAATGVVEHLFAPVNTTTTYTPPAAGVSAAGPSTIIIKVPNTGVTPPNQVRVRIRQRESTSAEGYYLDNLAIKVRSNLLNNAAVTQLEAPVNFCAGYSDVKVRIANRGNNVINNVTVNWTLDNIAQSPLYWTSPLDTPGGANRSDTVVTLGNYLFNASTAYNLKVWTSLPNFSTDPFNLDDTITALLKPSMSGTYTIGGTGADYANLIAAANDLNTFGVCGPVVFNIAPGTYSGQVLLNNIPGTSVVNTVNFIGSGKISCMVTASVASGPVVGLNQSKYILFRDMTITNTYSGSSTGLAIIGNTAGNAGSNIQIRNCKISLPNAFGYGSYGILMTSNTNGYTTASTRSDSIQIDSNEISGSYYGIFLNGASGATYNAGLRISQNTFSRIYYTGIYLSSIYNPIQILYNNIGMDSTGSVDGYGIYMQSCTNSSTAGFHHLAGNSIRHAGTYGMYLSSVTGIAASPSRIFNNMVAGNFRTDYANGIYFTESSSSYSLIYHNTVLVDYPQSTNTNGALYYSGSANVKIKNNIFAHIAATGSGIPVYLATSPAAGNLNFNLYYATNSNALLFRNSVVYSSANYLTTTAGGDSSYHVNPFFVNNTNVHINNGCLTGTNLLSLVSTDIDGDLRSMTPVIGADEITLLSNNLTVESIVSPTAPFGPGLQNLVVRVKNSGSTAITSFNITYVLNSAPVSIFWTGIINPCGSTLVTFTGTNQMNLGSINSLVVYTDVPNGFSDAFPIDDTLKQYLIAPLNGTYTIGGYLPDFLNFSEATMALKLAGVAGNVTFKVRTGTYNESVFLENKIAGVSDTSTVQFISEAEHTDSVLVSVNSTTLPVVSIDKTFYIRFSKMSFAGTNSAFGRVIQLVGDASYITFDSCKITGPVGGGYENIYAENVNGRVILFQSNQILNNAFGVYLMGQSTTIHADSFVFIGNQFMNCNSYAAYTYYTKNLKLQKNTVSGTGSYGFRTYYSYENAEITGNRINLSGTYGLYIYYSNGTATSGMLVANNTIQVTGNYGIRNQYGSYQKFLNNTISSSGSYGVYILYNANQNANEWINNIIHTSGVSASQYAAYISNAGTGNNWDYNLYYSGGANLFSGFATLDAWRASSGMDMHSLNYRLALIPLSLQPNANDSACWFINGRGTQTILTTDFTGSTRSNTLTNGAPDLGAFEFTPAVLPPYYTAIPSTPTAGGTQIFVLGGDTAAQLTWDIGYTPPASASIRKFTGANPPLTGGTDNRMNCFWQVEATPSGFYSYSLKMHYSDPLLGNITPESALRVAYTDSLNPYLPFVGTGSSVDITRNMLSVNSLNYFGYYTGTHTGNPLPVDFTSLEAHLEQSDVRLTWTTLNEKNLSHFVVEASGNGKDFRAIGKVLSNGNSSMQKHYSFLHNKAFEIFEGAEKIHYRIQSRDRDGATMYSPTVQVSRKQFQSNELVVFPNPVSSETEISIRGINPGAFQIKMMDLKGQLIKEYTDLYSDGIHASWIQIPDEIRKGIYLIEISDTLQLQVVKLVKD